MVSAQLECVCIGWSTLESAGLGCVKKFLPVFQLLIKINANDNRVNGVVVRTGDQELARRKLVAFLFGDSGVRALYSRLHLENIVLPAIDLVLLETGSNNRVEIFSTVLGLHPHTQIIFSSPPDTYPGVEAVPRTGEFNDGRNCPDLLYRHI